MQNEFRSAPVHVTKTFLPDTAEYISVLADALKKSWITNHGDLERALTEKLKAYFNVPCLSLCANGTLALQLALRACDVRGGEVITTPFTYVATSTAIAWEGALPVFADISPDTLMPTAESVAACITEKTRAILCVHVFGFPAPVEELQQLADSHGIPLVFDAAHAFGVIYKNRPLPSYGTVSVCSFHATKNFHTVEGGAVLCHDAELAEKLWLLGNFGHVDDEYKSVGINAKMSEFHAAMGICNLNHIEEEIAKRKVIGQRYYERLYHVAGIKLADIPSDLQWNYSYFPVFFDGYKENRDEIKGKLENHRIFARKYFYPIVNQAACYRKTFGTLKLPVAEHASECVLALPLYADMSIEDADRGCDVILK